MSTAVNLHALCSRFGEKLAEFTGEAGDRPTGRLVGCAGTTVADRGSDPAKWSIKDCAILAHSARPEAAELRLAALDLFKGHAPRRVTGDAVAAQSALFAELQVSADLAAEASRDLADGRIDSAEAARLLPLARRLRALLDAEVIPSLEAYARG